MQQKPGSSQSPAPSVAETIPAAVTKSEPKGLLTPPVGQPHFIELWIFCLNCHYYMHLSAPAQKLPLSSFSIHCFSAAFYKLENVNSLNVDLFSDANLLLCSWPVSALQSAISTSYFCPLQHTAKPATATACTTDRFAEFFLCFLCLQAVKNTTDAFRYLISAKQHWLVMQKYFSFYKTWQLFHYERWQVSFKWSLWHCYHPLCAFTLILKSSAPCLCLWRPKYRMQFVIGSYVRNENK